MGPARTSRDDGSTRGQMARGFTLLEAMMASAILAVAVAALCQAVVSGQMATAEALRGVRATLLADALLEEVLSLPYSDPQAPDTESTRATFDDIADFDGFVEDAGELADATGTAYPAAYQSLARSVGVTATTAAAPGATLDGLRVTVTVTDGRGGRWVVAHFVPEPEGG